MSIQNSQRETARTVLAAHGIVRLAEFKNSGVTAVDWIVRLIVGKTWFLRAIRYDLEKTTLQRPTAISCTAMPDKKSCQTNLMRK